MCRSGLAALTLLLLSCGDDAPSSANKSASVNAPVNTATSQRCVDVRADYNWRVRHAQRAAELAGYAGGGASDLMLEKQLDDIVNQNWDCFH